MIAFAVFLFALLVVAWMVAPGDRQAVAVETEPATGLQPEGQIASA